MELNALTAISPIDGRYRSQTEELAQYFSEYGLMRYRVRIESEYFLFLIAMGLPPLARLASIDPEQFHLSWKQFSIQDATEIKSIEKTTRHDVKAVEYFLKQQWTQNPNILLTDHESEFIHFGLTSQDINNTAIPTLCKEALDSVYYPLLNNLIESLTQMADQWISIPMLARTHGQPATPTTVGKEIRVFQARLENAKASLQSLPIPAKFGGATGSFNAHKVAYPQYHWPKLADQFLTEKFGLQRTQITTQIENYDGLAALLDAMARINIIIIDACRDFWTYISMEYFSQKTKPGEIGSSAMPHKVNPIDFENAEGNAGFSAAIAGHLSRTLPISRLQRDLTDSTLLRNIGLPFAHSLLAFKSMLKGLASLELNENKIRVDLNQNWEVLAEAVQTILRREGYPKPYETLLNLTRGKESLTPSAYLDFINQLEIREEVKAELRQLSPWDYLGYAPTS